MAASLRQLLAGDRVVFVAGKGGVGKTTVAGAFAIERSDAGDAVHLVSTDPAHSLRDLFALPGEGPADVCGGRIRLEEFDAAAYAARWTARTAPDLLALLEAGTYLDAADARRFVDLALPGIDEVMAAFRLVELVDGDRPIIVDTAPTGHTLRLLETGTILSTWTDALAAMAAKAGAVASAFTRGAVRSPGESLIEELESYARRFTDEVLAAAAAVVVTRSGVAVEAETARLLARLRERRVRPRAVVHTGDEPERSARLAADIPVLHVPRLAEPPGSCDGLRRWLDELRALEAPEFGAQSAAVAPVALQPAGNAAIWLDGLELRLLFFAGKGGVGKTTCAAAAALQLARSRPVLLFSTDPAGSLSEVLGRAVGPTPTVVAERLRARQVDAAAALASLRAEYERDVAAIFDRLGVAGAGAALDRRVIESLWNLAPPGMDEITALAGLLEAGAGAETIVVDAAPTGHFLRLLELPQLALDWTHALMRVLLKFGAGSLDGVAERLLAFAKQLKALQHTLADADLAGAFVVMLEEPMIQAETERLLAQLGAARISTIAVIVNRAAPGAAARASGSLHVPRRIAAPALASPPAGNGPLARFVEQWELLR